MYVVNEDGTFAMGEDNKKLYRCLADIKGEGNQNTYARNLGVALNSGHTFGPYAIKTYSIAEVNEIMRPVNAPMLPITNSLMYRDMSKESHESYRVGFLDPFYNYRGHRSTKGKEYKLGLMNSWWSSTEAFLRLMLQHLKRLILDGYIISEMDVIARDFGDIEQALLAAFSGEEYDTKNIYKSETSQVSSAIKKESNVSDVIRDIVDSFTKAFAVRNIYPFLSAITDNDNDFRNLMNSRDFESLNAMLLSVSLGEASSNKVDKFLRALNGIGLIPESTDAKAEDVSDSQKTFNSLMKDV